MDAVCEECEYTHICSPLLKSFSPYPHCIKRIEEMKKMKLSEALRDKELGKKYLMLPKVFEYAYKTRGEITVYEVYCQLEAIAGEMGL